MPRTIIGRLMRTSRALSPAVLSHARRKCSRSGPRLRLRLAAPEPPARSTRDLGEELLGDVEVRGHPLDVVQILERFDEAQVLARSLLVDRDRALGDHRALGMLD